MTSRDKQKRSSSGVLKAGQNFAASNSSSRRLPKMASC